MCSILLTVKKAINELCVRTPNFILKLSVNNKQKCNGLEVCWKSKALLHGFGFPILAPLVDEILVCPTVCVYLDNHDK